MLDRASARNIVINRIVKTELYFNTRGGKGTVLPFSVNLRFENVSKREGEWIFFFSFFLPIAIPSLADSSKLALQR